MISFNLSSSVRSKNQHILSMISMLASAITNIILDYIFIVNFGWRIKGAALATIIALLISYKKENSKI